MIGRLHHKVRLALGPVGSELSDHVIHSITEKMVDQNKPLKIQAFLGKSISEVSFYYLVSDALEALQR